MKVLEASCVATAEALSDRLDGELRGLHRLLVAHHLARCQRCRSALASLARLVAVLRTLPDPNREGSCSAVDGVLARLCGETAADDGG